MRKEAYNLGVMAAMVDSGLLPSAAFEKQAFNIIWNPAESTNDVAANTAATGSGLAVGGGTGLAMHKLLAKANPKLRALGTALGGLGAGLGTAQLVGSAVEDD